MVARVHLHIVGVALALELASLSWTTSAEAQRTGVVVMPFDGPGSAAIRRQVHEALTRDERLDVAPLDRGAPSARVLVSGTVTGRGARQRLELVASDAEGRELATRSGRIGRGAAHRRTIEDATRALMDEALARLPREREAPRPAPSSPPPEATSDESTALAPAESQETGELTRRGSLPLLSALAGIVARNRTAEIRLGNGGSQLYDSGFYVEVAARLELRPLAADSGLARGLYLRADYAHAVGLGTQDCGSGTCMRYETVFFRIAGDLGFLFPLGDVVEFGLGVGFGFDAYQIADNRVLPGVEYPYLRPAVRGRVRIVEETVVIDGEVALRSLFGRERLSASFGADGDSFGMDAGLGLGGVFDFGLAWRLDLTWASYWHQFAGAGSLQSGQNGVDQGVRIGAMLGYGLR